MKFVPNELRKSLQPIRIDTPACPLASAVIVFCSPPVPTYISLPCGTDIAGVRLILIAGPAGYREISAQLVDHHRRECEVQSESLVRDGHVHVC